MVPQPEGPEARLLPLLHRVKRGVKRDEEEQAENCEQVAKEAGLQGSQSRSVHPSEEAAREKGQEFLRRGCERSWEHSTTATAITAHQRCSKTETQERFPILQKRTQRPTASGLLLYGRIWQMSTNDGGKRYSGIKS